MTVLFRPSDEDVREESAAMSNIRPNERMTVLEVELATALWLHGRVKVQKDALQRIALDLAEHTNPKLRQKISEITWGDFYNGSVGVPTAALEVHRKAVSPFVQTPEDYLDGSCI